MLLLLNYSMLKLQHC